MSNWVTRCPVCLTAFRVGEEQLELAHGRVRCGACAQVFAARAHRIGDAPMPSGNSADADISQNYIDELLLEPPPPTQTASPAPQDGPPAPPLIIPLPVEIERVPATRRGRRMAWTLACLCALFGLVAQYAWYNRETLAREPRYRPWYTMLCDRFGCHLPAYRDFARIRSDALQIRPAPGRPGLLLVDAVLSNHAPFAQEFPGIEIEFSDMQGRVLASRVFLPHEYLEPQLAASAGMPPREPVPAHLDLKDPGEDATNYRLYLREVPHGAR